MSDKTFERSLTALSALVLLWIVLGIVFGMMGWITVVIIGLLVEIVGGGALLYYWGKAYMARS